MEAYEDWIYPLQRARSPGGRQDRNDYLDRDPETFRDNRYGGQDYRNREPRIYFDYHRNNTPQHRKPPTHHKDDPGANLLVLRTSEIRAISIADPQWLQSLLRAVIRQHRYLRPNRAPRHSQALLKLAKSYQSQLEFAMPVDVQSFPALQNHPGVYRTVEDYRNEHRPRPSQNPYARPAPAPQGMFP